MKQKPVMLRQTPSPTPMQRQTRSETSPIKIQGSKTQAINKSPEKEHSDWRVKTSRQLNNPKSLNKPETRERNVTGALTRGVRGAGEPRIVSNSPTRITSSNYSQQRSKEKYNNNVLQKNFMLSQEREKQLNNLLKVTPHYQYRPNYTIDNVMSGNRTSNSLASSPFNTDYRANLPSQQRRRLGRSPSPSPCQSPVRTKDSRATNTPIPSDYLETSSKSALREALSRLKLTMPRDGSVGAASVGAGSLGARREAPPAKRAPSVRSDERPLATQGDMLNSIKFQRRFRETLNAGRITSLLSDNLGSSASPKDRLPKPRSVYEPSRQSVYRNFNYLSPREKTNVAPRDPNSKMTTAYRLGFVTDTNTTPKSRSPSPKSPRPASPPTKPRPRNVSSTSYR